MTSSQEENKHSPQNNVSFFTPDFLARLISVITFFIWSYIVIRKYINFGYDDWDLAFFNQATYNLLHGRTHSSLFDNHFFGNHSNFIAYLCLPIYAIFAHALTLVHLKILSVISGGYVFYLITKDKLGAWLAVGLMILYFVYPPNIFAILYDFDYESLCPVFLFGLYYFFIKDKWFYFLLLSITTMLIKENMPLIIMAFGLLGFFSRGKNKIRWGVVPLLLGFFVFYFLTMKIVPSFAGKDVHGYIGIYKTYGNSPMEILSYVLLNPIGILAQFFTPVISNYLFMLFLPVLFLPFLSPAFILLLSPILLQHILSSAHQMHTIHFQYGITLAPFIFLGTAQTLYFVKQYCRKFLWMALCFFVVVSTLYNIFLHKSAILSRAGDLGQKKYLNGYAWNMVKKIPPQESVIATLSFLSGLSNRQELYAFHKVYSDDFQSSANIFKTPASVNYALIDFNNPWLRWKLNDDPRVATQRIRNFYFATDWFVSDLAENYVLLQKKDGTRLIDVYRVNSSLAVMKEPVFFVDQKFSLISFRPFEENVKVNSLYSMEFVWHSLEKLADRYIMIFVIKKQNQVVYMSSRDLGYVIYPTMDWDKDVVVKEICNMYIPKLAKGEYTLEMSLVNLNKRKEAKLFKGDQVVQEYTLKKFGVR